MKQNEYIFNANVWLYPGKAAWHFVTIPQSISKEISHLFHDLKRGWGSLPVTITCGNTSWNTSLFPDKQSETYVLPLKASIREKEHILVNTSVTFRVKIRN